MHNEDKVYQGEHEMLVAALRDLASIVATQGTVDELHAIAESLMILQQTAIDMDKEWDVSSGEPELREKGAEPTTHNRLDPHHPGG